MVRYLNPGGYDLGSKNLDGWGISHIVVAVTYSLFFYASCLFLWLYRHHPTVQKRNVSLLLMSLLTLHVFFFLAMIVYTLNGAFPCQVEFWDMNLYLPIGIGLFQAQNQQLLIVSQEQAQLIVYEEPFRRLPPQRRGVGGLSYWLNRFKVWWERTSKARQYQAYVFVGIIVQFTVSMIVYNISRKFNRYGVVGEHVGPALCRRGWEWAPSIVWQFLWNWLFGPYLIWKIRMIRDIYHWRLQTVLAIVAGLPGTPLWLASVYTDSFGVMNKYWVPPMWFAPGLATMEIVTLGFPIYQIFKYKRAARETRRHLDAFDQKQLLYSDDSTKIGSLRTDDTTHSSLPSIVKRSGMYPMETLDECLSGNHDGLQIYASCMELNGENIKFLTRVLVFRESCSQAFQSSRKTTTGFEKARVAMFRVALSIFVSLVHARTASYPINIESVIYARLDSIFGPATTLIASERNSRGASITTGTSSSVTPWDEPQGQIDESGNGSYPMHIMGGDTAPQPPHPTFSRMTSGNESRERILRVTHVVNDDGSVEPGGYGGADPLEGVKVPADFDDRVFDAAFKSVRYMVWTETWQRYMNWEKAQARIPSCTGQRKSTNNRPLGGTQVWLQNLLFLTQAFPNVTIKLLPLINQSLIPFSSFVSVLLASICIAATTRSTPLLKNPHNSTTPPLTVRPDPHFAVRTVHWGPKLRSTGCFLTAVNAMANLALRPLDEAIGETVFELADQPGVAISVLPRGWQSGGEMQRKYAVWGLFYAIYDMNKYDHFRCSTLHLMWDRDEEVGTMGFSRGVLGRRPGSGLLGSSKAGGDGGVVVDRTSVARGPVLSLHVDLLDTVIAINVVFVTVIGALGDLALLNDDDDGDKRVTSLVFDQAPVPAFVSFETYQRRPPFMTYGHVVEALAQLPRIMLEKRMFTEADIVVMLDGEQVGFGLLRKLHIDGGVARGGINGTDSW